MFSPLGRTFDFTGELRYSPAVLLITAEGDLPITIHEIHRAEPDRMVYAILVDFPMIILDMTATHRMANVDANNLNEPFSLNPPAHAFRRFGA